MDIDRNNRQYLNEVWKRVRLQEYERNQIKKVEERNKTLRKMELKLFCKVFGSLSLMSFIFYLILGLNSVGFAICVSAYLIGAQIYDYLNFNEAKRRSHSENSNQRIDKRLWNI